ncbi:hypothetical protein SKAU_G00210160 [Synaphobranchus kaupii]|uniref:Uncharacterized protein n=1 Tax=Synaphobranchus kaupii TaxID=118154 RepID=A0A9Q1IUH4_SYNKA|nr:hypothetical protein SKAU_G00210160 [Synaphobranchus kaupii]
MDDPVTKGNDRADAAAKEAVDHTSALSCEEPVHKRQCEKVGCFPVMVSQVGPDEYRDQRTGKPVNEKGGPLNCPYGNPLSGPRPELTTTLQDEPVPAQQNEESQDPQETGGRDRKPNLESSEGTAGQKARPMVTKQLTAPEVMAPLLYLEKLPREDEHDLQDFTYTKECE